MSGKPTIDILVTIPKIEQADKFADMLEPLGYKFLGQYVMEDSRLYAKEKDGGRLVNLHFYPEGHKHVAEMISLRNHRRSYPEVVQEYSQLKHNLVKKYPDDYGSYRKFKDAWMNALKAKLDLV